MLRTRIYTALYLLPLLACILWLGGKILLLASLIVFGVINYEFFSISHLFPTQLRRQLVILSFLLPLGYLYYGWGGLVGGMLLTVMLAFVILLLALDQLEHEMEFKVIVPASFLGFCYSGLLGTILVIIASTSRGNSSLAWLFTVVIASDTLAYFVGKAFGKRKLLPRVSPAKTIEGAIAGLVGAVVFSMLAGKMLHFSVGLFPLLFFGILAGVLVQLGDLIESLIKRIYGVKDAGSFLPGHGGLLDRLDGLLFSLPVLFLTNFSA